MTTMMHWRILVVYVGMCTTLSFSRGIPGKVIRPNCDGEVILPCAAKSYSHMYTSVIWYKVSQNEQGIIRKQNGISTPYPNYINVASFMENYSLVLRNVTSEHAGVYKCQINAKVGWKNNHSLVMLNTSECITETAPTSSTPDFTTLLLSFTNSTIHASNSSVISEVRPVDVTSLSAFVGFVSIGLMKVLLCALCVWAVVEYKKHRRRRIWS